MRTEPVPYKWALNGRIYHFLITRSLITIKIHDPHKLDLGEIPL